MVAPTRDSLRSVLAVVLALGMTLQGAPAQAQSGPVSLIRDTEIENILQADAEPLYAAAGLNSKSINILLIGSEGPERLRGPRHHGGLYRADPRIDQRQPVAGRHGPRNRSPCRGHSARSGDMTTAGLKPFLLTMGLGVLAALAGNTEAGAVLAGNASFFGTLGALGYSREQESRADQAGLTYLETANLSGRGLVDFFDNFRYQEVFEEARRYPYFRSHPLSLTRIEALRVRAEKLTHFSAPLDAKQEADHAIMKAKLQGFINPTIAIAKCGDKDQDFPTRYACAIAQYQLKEPEKALKLVDALIVDQPDNPYLWELKGQILSSSAAQPRPRRRSESR